MSYILQVFYVCLVCTIVNAISPHKAMVFLNRYGYLNLPNRSFLNSPFFERSLMVDGSYKEAIKKFQTQFKLLVTGKITPEVVRLLTASRCGNPDFKIESDRFSVQISTTKSINSLKRVKRYFIDDPRMKWLKKDLTWKIISYPTSGLTTPAVDAIFTRAFNMWSKVADLNYRRVDTEADIIIEFKKRDHGDSIPFDGKNYVLAHAFYPIGAHEPKYSRAGDAHFDDDEEWVDSDVTTGRNLLAVAVHELGHSMGLGHSASEHAIMYPFYISPSGNQLELNSDDIEGMQTIYGAAQQGKILPPIPNVPSDGHKYTPPTSTTEATVIPGKLDMCNSTIDAIIIIREVEIYVFSGNLQWRIDFSRTVTSWISYELRDGPESISYYWPVLPKDVDHIDGGIERKDQKIYIFRGTKFWLVEDNQRLVSGVPKEGLPLTDLGLPYSLKKIDTIFRWGYNKALYIMAGYQYWKINEDNGKIGYIYPRYPRNINSVWKNVPFPVDVAFTDLHYQTYFIKNKFQYEFNNLEMRVDGNAEPLNAPWIGCKKS